MSWGISEGTLKRLRETYKPGTRVVLEQMDDPQAPPIGSMGTVRYVDDIGNIGVAWDCGGSLAVAYGIDSCRVVG